MSKEEKLVKDFLEFHNIKFTLKGNEVIVPLHGVVTIACKMSLLQDSLSRIFDAIRSENPIVDEILSIVDGLLAAGAKKIPGILEPPECNHSNVLDHGDHMHCEDCGFMYPKIKENAN